MVKMDHLRTGVNQFRLPDRSDAVLHDALHAVGAGDAVALPAGRLPGDHQAGLPGDQDGAPRGVHGGVPQRRRQDVLGGAAAHPGRAEALGAAVQGRAWRIISRVCTRHHTTHIKSSQSEFIYGT